MSGDKLKRILFKGDKVIWIVFIILCAISWIEVFSATSRQTYGNTSYWSPIIKHTGFLIGGIFVAWFIHNLKAQWIDKCSKFFYWTGLVLLIWAQVSGTTLNDSARWIRIPGVGLTFQPMEIAKMGLVMMTARLLAAHQDNAGLSNRKIVKILNRIHLKIYALFNGRPRRPLISDNGAAFAMIMVYALPPIAIIFKENFSSAFLLAATIFLMMFVGRIPQKQLLGTLGITLVLGAIGFTAIMTVPESLKDRGSFGGKVITWKHRFKDALDSTPVTPEEYNVNENPQKTFSHIAVASSHIIGRGPGNSIQRDHIPHAYSDYIFAVIIEELGLLGAIVVVLLYLTLLYTCGKIAKKCDDPYTAFLSIGIGMIIVTQALLHMYISVGNFVTGQPLPLMSQGGTSFLINSVYIGFLLCISRYAYANNDKKKAAIETNV